MDFQPIAITTTSDEKAILESIAKHLIDNRLAACAQVSGPVTSWYRWKDEVENAEEWLCLIKTDIRHFDSIKAAIHRLHNYDQPQLVAFEIIHGSSEYLEWVKKNTD